MFKTTRIHARPGCTIYRFLSVKTGVILVIYALAKTLDEAVHFGSTVANFYEEEVELRPVNPLHPLRFLTLNIKPTETSFTLCCYVDLCKASPKKEGQR